MSNFCFSQEVNCKEDFFPSYSEKSKAYGYKNMAGIWRIRPFYTNAFTFYGKCAVVVKGTKYGVINCKGLPIVQPIYDLISPFKRGVAWAKQGSKWGLINDEGKILLACELDSVIDVNRFSKYTWVQKNNVWGLYNKDQAKYVFTPQFQEFAAISDDASFVKKDFFTGVIKHDSPVFVVEPILERVLKFSNSCFGVMKAKKWGLINREGIYLKPFVFDSIGVITQGRLISKTNQGYQVLNMEGNPINTSFYTEIGEFKSGIFRVKLKDVYSYMNFYGKTLDLKFKEASEFNLFRAIVKTDSGECILSSTGEIISKAFTELDFADNSFFIASKNNEKFLLNKNGKKVMEDGFLDIKSDSLYMICVKDLQKETYYNVVKDTLIDHEFQSLSFYNGKYAFAKKENKWGLIDENQQFLFTGYDSIQYTSDLDVYIVKSGKKWGAVSKSGKELVKLEHDGLQYSTVYVYEHKHKFGILNHNGEVLAKAAWDSILVHPDYANWITYKKKKYNIIDSKKGVEKLEESVSNLSYFGQGFYKVKSKDFWGVLNQYGKPILGESYDEILSFSEHLFAVKTSKGWGYANETGRLRIACQYESASPFVGGVAVVSNWGKFFAIDPKEQKLSIEFDKFTSENKIRVLKSKGKELIISPDGTFVYRGIN